MNDTRPLARKSPRKPPTEPPAAPKAIVLQLGPHKFSVAVWIGEHDDQPVYYILRENIREAALAATVARRLARELERSA